VLIEGQVKVGDLSVICEGEAQGKWVPRTEGGDLVRM